MSLPTLGTVRIAIIGLGYVGLPLAVYLARKFPVVGFDISRARIDALKAGVDSTGEVTDEEMQAATHLTFTADPRDLADANVYIVTVPTPIDEARRPDLGALEKASATVGRVISRDNVVVYEFDRLSGRDRGGLRSDRRARIGPRLQARLPRRLQPRAHQSR